MRLDHWVWVIPSIQVISPARPWQRFVLAQKNLRASRKCFGHVAAYESIKVQQIKAE
jgi:hypothetical protein